LNVKLGDVQLLVFRCYLFSYSCILAWWWT